ncbi:PH domain-containing protein [Labedaea rhizosphaerae]|uniref:PH (Pleckstrin Homology) domain-containing protein n=1 Tax=Labedaea rhizosphaerae TaxID=598644 RepID=A0A4V3CZH5_LABRH|nr:PH domain-containing protein [Labedaea rhizosphaerae]TDP98068.1 PH (Pleckstrin Homology) domain-containing protein [Labedaea rhizosphaerae]
MSDQYERVVFRVPAVGILAALLLAACATPIAVTLRYGWLVYLVPLVIIVFVMRTRTVADGNGMVARTFFGRTVVPWDALRSLRVQEKSWVKAVLDGGREVTLPAVRTGSIPLLSQVSGGIVPDPSAPVEDPAAEPAETSAEEEAVEETGKPAENAE